MATILQVLRKEYHDRWRHATHSKTLPDLHKATQESLRIGGWYEGESFDRDHSSWRLVPRARTYPDLPKKALQVEDCSEYKMPTRRRPIRPGALKATRKKKLEDADFLSILGACSKYKDLSRGSQLHLAIERRGLVKVCSDALVTMYAQCGALAKARELFSMYTSRDIITWTALIASHVQQGQGQGALNYFEQMQHEGLSPDVVSFACVLKACASLRALDKGEKIHEEIAKQGLLQNNVRIGTALVDMYAKCGALAKARCVLEELPIRNAFTWNALITGYAEYGKGEEAIRCFAKMQNEGFFPDRVTFLCLLKACGSIGAVAKGRELHVDIAKQGLLQKHIMLGTALVDMYAKCGAFVQARTVLKEHSGHDVASWNALITGLVQHNEHEQAFECYDQLQHEGLSPNTVTFLMILKACGCVQATAKGEEIHHNIAKQGLLERSIIVGAALVYMYAKCGALAKAQQVFEELPSYDAISWSALTSGLQGITNVSKL